MTDQSGSDQNRTDDEQFSGSAQIAGERSGDISGSPVQWSQQSGGEAGQQGEKDRTLWPHQGNQQEPYGWTAQQAGQLEGNNQRGGEPGRRDAERDLSDETTPLDLRADVQQRWAESAVDKEHASDDGEWGKWPNQSDQGY